MGKLANHVNLGEEVILGGDTFLLKPLSTKHLIKMFKVAKHFTKIDKDISDEDMISAIPEAAFDIMAELVEATIDKSFPDETEEQTYQFTLLATNEYLSAGRIQIRIEQGKYY